MLVQIANSIQGVLEFTGECLENGKPLACLVTQLWVGKPVGNPWYMVEKAPSGEIETPNIEVPLYNFYKEPVASKIGTLAGSVVPEKCKIQTAMNEFKRRRKTTSTLVNSQ